jgi:hypothetical protein
MLRTNEQEKADKPTRDQGHEALTRGKAGARRTAWIIGAIAAAFFIASLVQGHLFHIPG